MPKVSKEQMKDDAEKVIQHLVEDSSQSPYEIATKCGFSRQKVWRIINRLEEENRIWGYTAVVDENKLGLNIFFALTRNKVQPAESIEKIIKSVKEKKVCKLGINVLGNYYLNGVYDWITIFTAKDITDAKIFCSYIQKEYGEYVERIDLLENVFPIIQFGKINPEINQLKKFALQ